MSSHDSQGYIRPLYTGPESYATEFDLDNVKITSKQGRVKTTITFDYDSFFFRDDELISVYDTTSILVLTAIIMTFILLVTSLIVGFLKGKGAFIVIVIAAFTVLFTVAAPLYFMSAEPAAMKSTFDNSQNYKDPYDNYLYTNIKFDESVIVNDEAKRKIGESFSGSIDYNHNDDDNDYINGIAIGGFSWGGSTGWYMVIVSSVLNLVALVILFFFRRQSRGKEYNNRNQLYNEPELYQDEQPIIYDAEPAVSKTLNISCYKCKKRFRVKDTGRPLKVECPHCGSKGELG